jgi:spore protease
MIIMFKNVRTDLAVEAKEIYQAESKGNIQGVEVIEDNDGDINVTRVNITNEIGERNMGKPMGAYITIDMPSFTHYDAETMDEVSRVMAKNLSNSIRLC